MEAGLATQQDFIEQVGPVVVLKLREAMFR
jgi:hypothetical protein